MSVLDAATSAALQPIDTSVLSSNLDYSSDINHDLDMSLSFDNAGSLDYPVWTEDDILSRELTDSILGENFVDLDNRNQQSICDVFFNENQFTSDSNNGSVTSDLIWNSFDGVEQCYSENTNSSTEFNNSNDMPDLHIYQLEDNDHLLINNHEQKTENTPSESWTDACNFDILKDNLFELDLFNDCFKEVENSAVASTPDSFKVPDGPITSPPIVEWNRRRSLLFDKNEFVRSAPETRSSFRRNQEVIARMKPLNSAPRNNGSIPNDQRIFHCPVPDCEKTYCKASHLKSHMRRHSGIKPFICDWAGCKWRFSRSDELARHKRSHSGIKPYSCDLCEKSFSRSDHLSKHAKVHMKKLALYGTPIITKKCNYKYLTVNSIPAE